MTICLKSYVNSCAEALSLGNHLVMFSASGNMKNLFCHLTSEIYVMEGSCSFISGSSSLYVTTLLSLLAPDIVVVEIYTFLVSQVI